MDWLDLLAVQGTLRNLLQYHSSKASVLQHSALFMVQLSHPYMTTGKTIALTRWIFVSKVMSLLFNMLPRLAIAFFQEASFFKISQLQSSSAVILETKKIIIVCEAVVGDFWNSLCFFYDPTDDGNLISSSSAFSKSILYIWKFLFTYC